MNERKEGIPVIALRGITLLPGMLVHFDIKRPFSIAAIQAAMEGEQLAFLVAQKNESTENPKETDLEEIGTLGMVKQILRLPGDVIRVMVSGIRRAHLDELCEYQPYLRGNITVLQEEPEMQPSEIRQKALVRNLHELIGYYAAQIEKGDNAAIKQLMEIENLEKLLDETAIVLPLSQEIKQSILEEVELMGRYDRIVHILSEEIQIARIRKEFQIKVKEEIDQNQKEYILREQLKVIHEELGDSSPMSDGDAFMEELSRLQANSEVKAKIEKEIRRFKNVPSNSSEGAVMRSYIETLLELPWDKAGEDTNDLKKAMNILNRDHYGLEKVKERIIEFLAVRSLTKKGSSPIICLVGPPGTGKTSIGRSIAEALNKKYVRISLGGVKDEAEIRGHRRTYIGSMPGRIVTGLKNAGVKNPLMLLDEIDKLGNDYKGDPASAMLEVLDSEQNCRFADHYIEIPVDLSEVLFVATANTTETIPRPLLDRMELIEVSSYTANEKFHIAKEHLIAKQVEVNGLNRKQIAISDKAIAAIIEGYTREAGVRSLERKIGTICRKAAREILEEGKEVVKVTARNLDQFLGKVRYTQDHRNEKPSVGIVRGLAWTSMGGELLQVEVNVLKGKGEFILTGQLGDVMKESAAAGVTYIRSIGGQYDIPEDYVEQHDIHVHIPEGAVPKDGPSAGITMATAIFSAVTGKLVRSDVAMTGEITLRGRVLPVGGLKEKLLAAKTSGMHLVIVPASNKKDVEELSEEITGGMEIVYASRMEEVLEHAICRQ